MVELARKVFEHAGILDLEATLWINRVKIAASISRIRIKHSALRLNDLLPGHLRDERITRSIDKNPVTCWVNIKKVKLVLFSQKLFNNYVYDCGIQDDDC